MAAVVIRDFNWTPRVINLDTSLVEPGVAIYVYDNDGTLVVDGDSVQTDAQGVIPAEALINAIYTDSGAGFTTNDETPHKIIATKYTGTVGLEITSLPSTILSKTTPDLFIKQNPNITLDVLAVSGFTDITVNPGGDLITTTISRTLTQVFHYAFYQGSINPTGVDGEEQYISTVDGNNFNSPFDFNVNGGTLDGENKGLTAPSLTVANGADVQNLTFNGNVSWGNTTNITNFSCTGVFDFTVAGTYNLVGGTLAEVTNSSGGAVTINLQSGASVTVNTGPNITIPVGAKFSFEVNPIPTPDYEYRIYEVTAVGSLAGAVEVQGLENATALGYSLNHQYTNQPIGVQIISNEFEEAVRFFTLTNTDSLGNVINLEVDTND